MIREVSLIKNMLGRSGAVEGIQRGLAGMGEKDLRCCMGLMEGFWALGEPGEKNRSCVKATKGFSGYYQALIQGSTSLPSAFTVQESVQTRCSTEDTIRNQSTKHKSVDASLLCCHKVMESQYCLHAQAQGGAQNPYLMH